MCRVGSGNGFSSREASRLRRKELSEFTFIDITDSQGDSEKDYNVWKNTLDKALAKFPDAGFLLHTGDTVDDGESIWHWNQFMRAARDKFMKLPILPSRQP